MTELPVVTSSDKMDDDTLVRHMNNRHMPIAGLAEVRRKTSDPNETLLRRWHHHCHFRGYDDNDPTKLVNHTHADG